MVQTHSHLQPPFPLINESYESEHFPEWITVFLNSVLFCCKVNKVLQEFLENLQRCAKKAVICCLSWHAFRPHRGYWELRVVCISASQSSSADFLSIIDLGHFNLLAYSLSSHFSASYHHKKKAKWLKHSVCFIKLNSSPSPMRRSPCRYQRAETGTYGWLAAGSAGLHSNFSYGNLLGCYVKQDLQIHQLGPDSGPAAMQRLNQLSSPLFWSLREA